MKKLYVIGGCNGAGKTTASFTILPEILDCKEYVNADEIARGISPFQPEKVSIAAGRLMLQRIRNLLDDGENFAFETTLASRTHLKFIEKARRRGYQVTILFFWLYSPELAVLRVKQRVCEGGHNIPENVIRRRYKNGLQNFFNLYLPVVDNWMFVDNSGSEYEIIAEGTNGDLEINNNSVWIDIKDKIDEYKGTI